MDAPRSRLHALASLHARAAVAYVHAARRAADPRHRSRLGGFSREHAIAHAHLNDRLARHGLPAVPPARQLEERPTLRDLEALEAQIYAAAVNGQAGADDDVRYALLATLDGVPPRLGWLHTAIASRRAA